MNTKIGIAALTLAAGLAAAPSPSAADPHAADVTVRIKASPGIEGGQALRRGEIFRILQGGNVSDTTLSAHLWQVAGSLAQSGWNPPRVTVRLVTDEPAGK